MAFFTAIGRVPEFGGGDFKLRVDNADDLEAFWREQRISTVLTRAEGCPVLGISRGFASGCRAGDRVRYTFETVDRQGGRGIRGVELAVLEAGSRKRTAKAVSRKKTIVAPRRPKATRDNRSHSGPAHPHEHKGFYVYEYHDLLKHEVIYVGKGKGYRATEHLRTARKAPSTPLHYRILSLGEENVQIKIVQDGLTESRALRLEVDLIARCGRQDLGTGPLLNRTAGGEGVSGGLDVYGYHAGTIAGTIAALAHRGVLMQRLPEELNRWVAESGRKFKTDAAARILPHLQEMGNVGCHYKGPKVLLRGWQFSLDSEMIDVNTLTLGTVGLLKVHPDLPFNEGFVADKPYGYEFDC